MKGRIGSSIVGVYNLDCSVQSIVDEGSVTRDKCNSRIAPSGKRGAIPVSGRGCIIVCVVSMWCLQDV